jgi:hypothetical protein
MNVANFATYIRARALADTTLTALIGQRFYLGVAPKNATYPYIVMTIPNVEVMDSFDVPNWKATFRLTVYAQADALNASASATSTLSTIIDRLNGDWQDQTGNAPSYGLHRYSPLLHTPPGQGQELLGEYKGSPIRLVATALNAEDENKLSAMLEFETLYTKEAIPQVGP